MIENLKKLVSQMDSKKEYKKEVSDYFGVTYGTVNNHWLGGGWKPPEHNLAKMVDMAQIRLSEQIKFKQELLKITGYGRI